MTVDLVSVAIASHSGQFLRLSIIVPWKADYRAATVDRQRATTYEEKAAFAVLEQLVWDTAKPSIGVAPAGA